MSKIRVAINGFGRIGRNVARAYFKHYELYKDSLEIVAINDITDFDVLFHLFKYDSVHGVFKGKLALNNDVLEVEGHKIKLLACKKLEELPWKDLNVDVVIESTGIFLSKEEALKHVASGAKRVLISAPAKGKVDATVVLGVNEKDITKDKIVYSNASCTTNCLAPMLRVLEENFGIEAGFMNTIHSYTKDQSLVDSPHKDLRRARAAAVSLIPSTTGATKAVEEVIPALKGKLMGYSVRVPSPDGSLTDFTARLKKPVTMDEINAAFKKASETTLKGILEYQTEPIVSIDIVGNPSSCVYDSLLTQVVPNDNTYVRVVGWYDNEWGYSNRVLDVTALIGKSI